MTRTTSPGLDSLVLQWNMDRRDRALAMLKGSDELLAQLRAEIARLEETGGARELLKTDAISQQLHRILKTIEAATRSSDSPHQRDQP